MILVDDKGHMVSDTSREQLHHFARKLGLKRRWFQDKRIPHYDLTTRRMLAKAIRHGAAYVSSREVVRRGVK